MKDNGRKIVKHNGGYMEEREKEIVVAIETLFVAIVMIMFLLPPFIYYVAIPFFNYLFPKWMT